MKVLTVDVGGTNVKLLVSGRHEPRKFKSGPRLTPSEMVRTIRTVLSDWPFDAVSIGYPGVVVHGRIVAEPRNLGRGWVGYNFARAFGRPVKIINDAAMQALGSYAGGRMLFLGLGTGFGSAMIVDGHLEPMELAHMPYKKGRTYEEVVGEAGRKRSGQKKWERHVWEVAATLKAALEPDEIVIGGGNAKRLERPPRGVRLGANANAFLGGFRLWKPEATGL